MKFLLTIYPKLGGGRAVGRARSITLGTLARWHAGTLARLLIGLLLYAAAIMAAIMAAIK